MKNIKSLLLFLFFCFGFMSITFAAQQNFTALLGDGTQGTTKSTIFQDAAGKDNRHSKSIIIEDYFECIDTAINNVTDATRTMDDYMSCYSKLNKEYARTISKYEDKYDSVKKDLKTYDRYVRKLSRCIQYNNYIRRNIYNQAIGYENCYLKFKHRYEDFVW